VSYDTYLEHKRHLSGNFGFAPTWMPTALFPFQQSIVDWAMHKGRAAIFADTGLGKTAMQLTWAENIVRKTNKRVLLLTPLAVADQTLREAAKFGIEASRSKTGILAGAAKIIVTNYESLHHFNPMDFIGAVCDESSALKSFDGVRRRMVTDFVRQMPYRLLCTATAAPNDYIELGTSSEALGELGHMDMLARFFRNDQNSLHPTSGRGRFERGLMSQNKWRFKRHAEVPFWRWVCSWARACRRPSDLGFDDDRFNLPALIEDLTVVRSADLLPGFLFEIPAVGLKEQREELRHTIKERCEAAAAKVSHNGDPAVVWCHLNREGDLLETIIPDARQVSGSQSDDEKEELFNGFAKGQIRVLITKPKIGAWGLNWQHCAQMTMFPSHSFEQYYQAIRRCWRFGQKRPVHVEIITTEGQKDVLTNLQRKAAAADRMFSSLVGYMNEVLSVSRSEYISRNTEIPNWITSSPIDTQSITTTA
jgi:hypothetical protein